MDRESGSGKQTLQPQSSSPSFTGVVLAGNSAGQDGGGMYNHVRSPSLSNVAVSGNDAGNNGGGLYNDGGQPNLVYVTFSGNDATSSGGGMYNHNGEMDLRRVLIWTNRDSSGTGSLGASLFNDGGTLTITYSLIQGWFPTGEGNLDGTDPSNAPLFIDPVDPANAPTQGGDLNQQSGSPAVGIGASIYDFYIYLPLTLKSTTY